MFRSILLVWAVLGVSFGAHAQSTEDAAAMEARAAKPDDLQRLIRGFSLDARVGGGYMALNKKLEDADIPRNADGSLLLPTIVGQSESLGPGGVLELAIGMDVTDVVTIEAFAGGAFVAGTRNDLVRDRALLYGGAGARLSFALDDRVYVTVSPGLCYVDVDNAVEKPLSGLGVHVAMGVEYYVHVRHFSLGVDLSALAPTSPFRLFVAILPHLKYTF